MGLLNLSCDLDKSTYDSLIALQQECNIPMDALIESAIKSYVNGFIKPKVKWFIYNRKITKPMGLLNLEKNSMNEITTNINVSGVPVSLLVEIDKISDIRSKAVVILIKEALEARKLKKQKKGN